MSALTWLFVAAVSAAPLASPTPAVPQPSASPAPGWVVIPVEDYRALRAKAYPVEPEAGPPPVGWTLSRIDCDLKVDGDSATGEARLTVDVMKDGWVRLPLPRTLKVRSARVNGRPVALLAEAGREPSVLLSKAGRVVLTLDIATPIQIQGGVESFSLPAASASLFRVLARIPRPALGLYVNGGVMTSKDEIKAEIRVVASVRPGENFQLNWRRRADPDLLRRTLGAALPAAAATGLLLWQVRTGPAAQVLAIPGAVTLVAILAPLAFNSKNSVVRVLGTALAVCG